MGGQACVLYGAAEFSRDADFNVLASPENLDRLQGALDELHAEVIAVPPFDVAYLDKGHAIHFRCHHPEANRFRIDIMSRLRGVDPFPQLWERRTSWELPGGETIDTLSLPDLVASKKTQRDKDWPMLRRLVEASYDGHIAAATPARIEFWLTQLRTPTLLQDCVERFPEQAERAAPSRPAVRAAIVRDPSAIETALTQEEAMEREADRLYWVPLRQELERLRHGR